MLNKVTCPTCRHGNPVTRYRGQNIKCSNCGERFYAEPDIRWRISKAKRSSQAGSARPGGDWAEELSWEENAKRFPVLGEVKAKNPFVGILTREFEKHEEDLWYKFLANYPTHRIARSGPSPKRISYVLYR